MHVCVSTFPIYVVAHVTVTASVSTCLPGQASNRLQQWIPTLPTNQTLCCQHTSHTFMTPLQTPLTHLVVHCLSFWSSTPCTDAHPSNLTVVCAAVAASWTPAPLPCPRDLPPVAPPLAASCCSCTARAGFLLARNPQSPVVGPLLPAAVAADHSAGAPALRAQTLQRLLGPGTFAGWRLGLGPALLLPAGGRL